MSVPQYDVVVFGATSFAGQILAKYLAGQFNGTGEKLRWAIAGRSEAKLEEIKRSMGDAGRATRGPLRSAFLRQDR